jgi:site-specific recombinase XerD
VMAGVDLHTVGELLGHRTAQMTKRYAHLSVNHKQAAVERISAVQSATKTASKKNEAAGSSRKLQ